MRRPKLSAIKESSAPGRRRNCWSYCYVTVIGYLRTTHTHTHTITPHTFLSLSLSKL